MFLEPRSILPNPGASLVRRMTTAAPSRGNDLAPQEVFGAVWQKRWTAVWTLVLCTGAAALYLRLATPVYTATSKLYVTPDVPAAAGPGGLERSKNYLNTQCELLKSTPILGRVAELPDIQAMKTFAEAGTITRALKEQLLVTLGNKDDLIELSLDSTDADEAAHVVNAVVESYVAYQTAQKRTSTTEMLKILRKEKDAWARELADKRMAVLKFKQENAVLSLQNDRGGGATILQRLAQLSEAKTEAQLEAMQTEAEYATLRAALSDPARRTEVATAIVTDAADTATERGRAALQNQLHQSQLSLSLMRRRHYGENNPLVVALVEHIAEAERRLADMDVELVRARVTSLEQSWRAAQQRLAAIEEAFQEQRKEALELNATAAKLAVLESGVDQAQKLIEGIEARIKELGVDGETGGLNVEVLEWAAAETEPSKPRKALVLVAAGLLGLILGSGLAFVSASTDRRVRSGEQIEDALGVPVLSAIPRIRGRRTPAAKITPKEFSPGGIAGDAYRTIRTAIYFGNRDHPIKTLLVTSAVKGEGKSTVASNLAAAMAHAGERTLLIDADLRRPSLHKVFDTDNRKGLSTILGGESQHQGMICVTGVDRLDLLPSGQIPSNPSELLSGARFAALLAQLAGKYDRIVLDAPPVLGMADALVLGARCDATLLVVRADVAERRATEAAFAALVNIGARSIATVLNCVRRGHTYSRYAHTYRRHDGGRRAPDEITASATATERIRGAVRADDGDATPTPMPAAPLTVSGDIARASEANGGVRVIDDSPGTDSARPEQRVDEQSHPRGGSNGTRVPLRLGR